jgi:3-oxoacyl-[acyl-carrier-protein] synthase-3
MKMDGRDVFKHAVTRMTDVARQVLERAGVTIDDVNLVIPHQANQRIVSAIGDRLGGDPAKYYVNLDRYGNTSAASVILALDEAAKTGRIKRGDLVLLVAFGGGFTWGATLLEW